MMRDIFSKKGGEELRVDCERLERTEWGRKKRRFMIRECVKENLKMRILHEVI